MVVEYLKNATLARRHIYALIVGKRILHLPLSDCPHIRGNREMNEMIAVFRMEELSEETRAKVITQLGIALNHQYGMNWTEDIVSELLSALDSI